jgi:nicotinamidase-related amidase
MSISKPSVPALILIDIQKGFANVKYWGGQRNNPDAEFRAGELLRVWRDNGFPVFHVQHCSTIPASPLHKPIPGTSSMSW